MTPLVLGLALTLAAPAPKKAAEPEGKLDGEWVVEKVEGPKADTPPGSLTLTFRDGKVVVNDSSRNGRNEEADYSVDVAKKPHAIDIKPKRVKDKIVQGIFEVKGDTARLCFGKDSSTRPTEFTPDFEKGVMVFHLKRVKTAK